MEKKNLGKTDIRVTPVGIGTLTMGFSQKNLSVEEGCSIIRYAIDRGINFLDTAQYYDTYMYVRPALDSLKADGKPLPVICSKTLESDYDGATDAVHQCLRDLDIDCVDIFLLHEVRGTADFEARSGAWQALKDLKTEGLVQAIGISTHHADACAHMAETNNCDVVFALINKDSLGIRTIRDGEDVPGSKEEMEQAIRRCSDEGLGVFTMKAFGGGNLIENYIPCLDYASAVKGNSCVMIGMASMDQVDAAVDYFDKRLSPSYAPDISAKKLIIDQSDCEGCGTCKERCVSQAIYWNENGLASIDSSKCVRCGYCAPVCPVRAIILL